MSKKINKSKIAEKGKHHLYADVHTFCKLHF